MSVKQLVHHEQQDVCQLRPAYRQGRKQTAIKVYTINLESMYLLIMGVPAVNLDDELETKCRQFGQLTHFRHLDHYPNVEQFTQVFLVKYIDLKSARISKRRLDNSSFYGGVLHVCFGPEFETSNETREKLIVRQKFVRKATKSEFNVGPWNIEKHQTINSNQSNPTWNSTENVETGSATYIWAGKTYAMTSSPPTSIDNDVTIQPEVVRQTKTTTATTMFVPRQLKTPEDTSSTLIRNKIKMLSAPNVPVTFKKRKT